VILWIDTQLSPALARWISETFGVAAHAVRDLGLREAKDLVIFHAAREAGAVVMSKDSDFVLLLERFSPPPQVLWVTCGNTSNARMREILRKSLPEARVRLEQGEPLVEISDAR
jgi:predicted nuclease of predicted toxin-antitoxin system